MEEKKEGTVKEEVEEMEKSGGAEKETVDNAEVAAS